MLFSKLFKRTAKTRVTPRATHPATSVGNSATGPMSVPRSATASPPGIIAAAVEMDVDLEDALDEETVVVSVVATTTMPRPVGSTSHLVLAILRPNTSTATTTNGAKPASASPPRMEQQRIAAPSLRMTPRTPPLRKPTTSLSIHRPGVSLWTYVVLPRGPRFSVTSSFPSSVPACSW